MPALGALPSLLGLGAAGGMEGQPVEMQPMVPEWLEEQRKRMVTELADQAMSGRAATPTPEGFPLTSPVDPMSTMGMDIMSQYLGGGQYNPAPFGTWESSMAPPPGGGMPTDPWAIPPTTTGGGGGVVPPPEGTPPQAFVPPPQPPIGRVQPPPPIGPPTQPPIQPPMERIQPPSPWIDMPPIEYL